MKTWEKNIPKKWMPRTVQKDKTLMDVIRKKSVRRLLLIQEEEERLVLLQQEEKMRTVFP